MLSQPATRFEFVKGELVSIVDLFRFRRAEDEPPLTLALGIVG